jgi:hypothetical protein
MRKTMALLLLAFALTLSADEHDFDYLLGDWEFTAVSQQWGKFRGYWSAVKLNDGQILDEYRVVSDDGAETYYVTTTLRNYNKVLKQWELVGADAGTGLNDTGTARRAGAEMHIEQRFGVMSANPSLARIRYFDIKADTFSWAMDRSADDGKTWVKNFQTIQAKRIGPARTLPRLTQRTGALAPARKSVR